MKKITLLMLLSFGITTIHAQEKWELVKNKNGIKVYVTEITCSEYYAFKAVMLVRATNIEIVKILKDVNRYPEWFAFTVSAKLINQSTHEQLFSMETDYPWPYSNECMNYHMEFAKIQNEKQKIMITGTNENINCKKALKKASGYILLEPDEGKTKMSYYFHSEPSQNIPTWLINPMIHKMPYQSFIAMRKILNSSNH